MRAAISASPACAVAMNNRRCPSARASVSAKALLPQRVPPPMRINRLPFMALTMPPTRQCRQKRYSKLHETQQGIASVVITLRVMTQNSLALDLLTVEPDPTRLEAFHGSDLPPQFQYHLKGQHLQRGF